MAETEDATPATAEAAATAAEPSPPVAAVRRRSPVWLVLGGVIAAGLGYGVAQVVPNGWPIAAPAPDLQANLEAEIAQVKALTAQVKDLSQRLDAENGLADRVAKLEAAPPPDAPPADAGQLAGLETRIAALESRPASGGADPAALQDLRAQVEALKAQGAGIVSPQVQADLDAKVKATEDKLAEVEAQAKVQATRTMTAAALRQIAAALDSGAPYAAALADIRALNPPAVLNDHAAGGLPTLQALQAAFPDAARDALAAALRANMGQSWSERVTNFLRSQTGARSLSPREGNDPDAILSRAQAATDAGDLATALKEIATLPPEGQAAMKDWAARVQLRLDGQAALAALQAQAG